MTGEPDAMSGRQGTRITSRSRQLPSSTRPRRMSTRAASIAVGVLACAADGLPVSTTYHLAAITVPDLEASVAWYETNLDFDIKAEFSGRDGKSRIVLLDRDGFILEIAHHQDQIAITDFVDPPPRRPLVQGIFKFGLPLTSFDSVVAVLRERSVVFVGDVFEDPTFAVRSVVIEDNSGIGVQLFERPSH